MSFTNTKNLSRGVVTHLPLLLLIYFLASALPGTAAFAQEPAATVGMTNSLDYQPASVTINVGETIKWENTSDLMHTVTADPEKATDPNNVNLPEGAEPFDSGKLDPGATFSHTFSVAGQYKYFCIPHEAAGMIATITVKEDSASAANSPEPHQEHDHGEDHDHGEEEPSAKTSTSETTNDSDQDQVVVGMTNSLKYDPPKVTIEAGQTVLWKNNSDLMHTVTADPELANNPTHVQLPEGAEPFHSGDMDPGAGYSRKFTVPGNYKYFCVPHEAAGMIGDIVVTEKGAGREQTTQHQHAAPQEEDLNVVMHFIRWLGNFHPPAISFPIGLLLTAALAELVFIFYDRKSLDIAVRFCSFVGGATAIGAGILGWFFAGFRLTDPTWVLTTHRWVGTGLMAWSIFLIWSVYRLPSGRISRNDFRIAIFGAALLAAANGFFGGAMIYGLDHYAWSSIGH